MELLFVHEMSVLYVMVHCLCLHVSAYVMVLHCLCLYVSAYVRVHKHQYQHINIVITSLVYYIYNNVCHPR